MKGLFISFEGTDGSGKSTHMRLMAEKLQELGYTVLMTREPGGCPISEKIREIVLDRENVTMTPVTEALLYAAARAQHVAEVIKPALAAGQIVITDRFVDSSVAYQGYGRGLGQEQVEAMNAPAIDGLLPDITFFLSVEAEEAVRRFSRQEMDRLEMAGTELQDKVRSAFLKLASESDRIVTIDSSRPKLDVHKTIADIVLERLATYKD